MWDGGLRGDKEFALGCMSTEAVSGATPVEVSCKLGLRGIGASLSNVNIYSGAHFSLGGVGGELTEQQ